MSCNDSDERVVNYLNVCWQMHGAQGRGGVEQVSEIHRLSRPRKATGLSGAYEEKVSHNLLEVLLSWRSHGQHGWSLPWVRAANVGRVSFSAGSFLHVEHLPCKIFGLR